MFLCFLIRKFYWSKVGTLSLRREILLFRSPIFLVEISQNTMLVSTERIICGTVAITYCEQREYRPLNAKGSLLRHFRKLKKLVFLE